MALLTFSILILWGILSVYSMATIAKKFSNSFKKNTKIDPKEKERIYKSIELLDSQPAILNTVSEIANLEKLPPNETRAMRSAILRAKLKLLVRNPVIRRALFDAIKLKKDN